jgi:hypothetical protein
MKIDSFNSKLKFPILITKLSETNKARIDNVVAVKELIIISSNFDLIMKITSDIRMGIRIQIYTVFMLPLYFE